LVTGNTLLEHSAEDGVYAFRIARGAAGPA
jgi:hypothetical protein